MIVIAKPECQDVPSSNSWKGASQNIASGTPVEGVGFAGFRVKPLRVDKLLFMEYRIAAHDPHIVAQDLYPRDLQQELLFTT